MQPITKLIFTGVDGSKYKFDVYPRGIRVNKGPAVYSFLSKVNGNYRVLYIGQTIDLSERLANHHKWDEAIRHGFEYPKSRSKRSRYSSENDVLIEKSVKYTDFFLLSIVYV